jgi:hypothetical protein
MKQRATFIGGILVGAGLMVMLDGGAGRIRRWRERLVRSLAGAGKPIARVGARVRAVAARRGARPAAPAQQPSALEDFWSPIGKNAPKQYGNSGRGPKDLDQAKENLRLPPEAVTIRAGEEHALAAGDTEQEELQEIARDIALEHPSPRPPQPEPPHRSGALDEGMTAAVGDQPGGDTPSDSERPDKPASRWGIEPSRR